jgi:hypothetical protein
VTAFSSVSNRFLPLPLPPIANTSLFSFILVWYYSQTKIKIQTEFAQLYQDTKSLAARAARRLNPLMT